MADEEIQELKLRCTLLEAAVACLVQMHPHRDDAIAIIEGVATKISEIEPSSAGPHMTKLLTLIRLGSAAPND